MLNPRKPLVQNVGDLKQKLFKKFIYLVVILTETLINLLHFAGSFLPITIDSPKEFIEEQPSKVMVTAEYTCPQYRPVFRWNYNNINAVTNHDNISKTRWRAVSTLTFTATTNDNGRSLTCTVQVTGFPRQEAIVTLRVKSEWKLSSSSHF